MRRPKQDMADAIMRVVPSRMWPRAAAGATTGALVLGALVALLGSPPQARAQTPSDPFLNVPAPTPRPLPPRPAATPAQPAVPPAQPRPSLAGGYPVGVGQAFRDCGNCPEMVVIPAGRFTMGSPASEPDRSTMEGPQREVVVPAPLAVGKFEVTFEEWDACVAAGGCRHRPADTVSGRGRNPVVNVGWDDAQQYVRWLSGRTGRSYRLLTEAEWEYAARAGTSSAYSFGSSIASFQANLASPGSPGRAVPVGRYAPNAWGLHDMAGNVWEWVQDCFGTSYAGAPSLAGQVVAIGSCGERVIRGGSWVSQPKDARSATRSRASAGFRGSGVGFRIARDPG